MDQWEPAEFHENVYRDGVLIGVRVTREPEFSPHDVAMLEAHLELEARPRNSLGVLLEEATDPANQYAYRAREIPLVDFALAAVEARRDAYYEQYPKTDRHGHIWGLKT